MKKNFIYLLLLCSLIAQAQVTPSYPTIKLTKTVEGVKQDSLLVVGTDKIVKHIPYSKISSVQEYATASALPVTGVAGKLYITKDNNKIYTWNGTFYSEFVGAKGEKGDQGIQGFKGDTGLTGADGAMGVQGLQGIQGIQGETGLRGIQGETGPQGPIGFTGEKGADGTGVSIKGSFDNTSQLPASGADGDAYLISGNLHVWNGTAWVNVGNIQGPQGLIGLTGATGSQGIQGAKGEKGDQGIQGIQGLKGDTGAKGDTGSFNGDLTADQVTETATRKFQTPTQSAYNDATSSIQGQLNGKENAFSKNTAFNKNFGTTAGTVVEGGTLGSNAYTSTAYLPLNGTAYNSTLWGGLSYDGAIQDQPIAYALTRDGFTDTYKKTTAGSFSTFLGLGTNAYTSTAYLPTNGNSLTTSRLRNFGDQINANALTGGGAMWNYGQNGAPSNTPSGFTWGSVFQFNSQDTDDLALQFANNITHNVTTPTRDLYFRSKNNLAWQDDWKKLWHDGNFNPANYLPLSGGTLSGAISGTSATFSGTVTASGGFFNSDRRLKNIFKRDGDVAYYTWKDGRDDKEHIGYVAQEVQENHPNQVQADEKGILSVNYVEILVEKIRMLEKRIEELEKK